MKKLGQYVLPILFGVIVIILADRLRPGIMDRIAITKTADWVDHAFFLDMFGWELVAIGWGLKLWGMLINDRELATINPSVLGLAMFVPNFLFTSLCLFDILVRKNPNLLWIALGSIAACVANVALIVRLRAKETGDDLPPEIGA